MKIRTDQVKWDAKMSAATKRRALREQAVAYKGGKCNICGYDRCLNAFDFHHLDPLEKDFTISNHMTSWDRIKKEIDKCVLVCSNCHREIHDGMHPGYLALEGADRGQYDEEPELMLEDEEECDEF
jgi:predicted HNH restriction endonuclease